MFAVGNGHWKNQIDVYKRQPMKESELVAGLRKLYSKPIPENCRISKMNPAPWNNPGKAKVTLSNLLAKRCLLYTSHMYQVSKERALLHEQVKSCADWHPLYLLDPHRISRCELLDRRYFGISRSHHLYAVSYTHLDVYKRQIQC